MASTQRLIEDAQAFLDSVKQFGTPERAAKYASLKAEANKNQEEEKTPPKLPELSFEKPLTKPSPRSAFPLLVLTDIRREAITFIETFYYTHKKLPNITDFKQALPENLLPKSPSDWEDFLYNLQDALKNRGVPVYDTPPGYLEPNFVLAVNLIINPYDRRSIAAKLKEAGLTTKQWTALLRLDHNKQYYQKRLNQIFDEDLQDDAKLALSRLIQAGDLQAIKHYHELQNIYRPQEQYNVTLILQAIMEILTLHVAPEIIGKVAESLRNSPQLKAIEV